MKERHLLWGNSQGGVQELASRQVHVQVGLREIHWSVSLLGSAHHFSQPEPCMNQGGQETQLFLKERRRGFSWQHATYFETSLSASKVFSRRVKMRILDGKIKISDETFKSKNNFQVCPVS